MNIIIDIEVPDDIATHIVEKHKAAKSDGDHMETINFVQDWMMSNKDIASQIYEEVADEVQRRIWNRTLD